MFQIEDGRASFWQWDLGQRLVVGNDICCEVHFCNKTDDCALVCEVYEQEGKRIVDVPNILLQTDAPIRVYAYEKSDSESRTLHEKRFSVLPRTKPADYVYTETELYTVEAAAKNALQQEKKSGALVLTEPQNLPEERQTQARQNIGAMQNGAADTDLNMNHHKITDVNEIEIDGGFGSDVKISNYYEGGVKLHFAGKGNGNNLPVGLANIADGTSDTDAATVGQLNAAVGDIETALDAIIAIQESLIGGAAE